MAEKKVKVTPAEGVTLRDGNGKKVPFGESMEVLESTSNILIKNEQATLVKEA